MTDRTEWSKIYKTHVRLLSQSIERKERSNRFYTTIFVGLISFVGAIVVFVSDKVDQATLELLYPFIRLITFIAILLFLSIVLAWFRWIITERAHRRIISNQVEALIELELGRSREVFSKIFQNEQELEKNDVSQS